MVLFVNKLRFVQLQEQLIHHVRCLCSQPTSNSKLFVFGLSWSVDDNSSLLDAFSCFAEVTEGRSRDFGFVQLLNEDDAKYAKDIMNGKILLGRPLRISYALWCASCSLSHR